MKHSHEYQYVDVAPGVKVGLKYTKDGRVKMLGPGGELDVTDGDCVLGLGLLEASRLAAQVRVRNEERARRRKERAK